MDYTTSLDENISHPRQKHISKEPGAEICIAFTTISFLVRRG